MSRTVRLARFAGLLIAATLALPAAMADQTDGWRPVAPPSTRVGAAMAYDSQRGKLVLFGGVSDTIHRGNLGDTWERDANGWRQVSTSGPVPRAFAAAAYDSRRGKVVLFGGSSDRYDRIYRGDTWEWDGRVWTVVASTGPSARMNAAMAYDSARGNVVLFGGSDGGKMEDTWEWNGRAWTLVAPTGPGARSSATAAYDSARGKVVLFGGISGTTSAVYCNDTWEWDGAAWTQAATSGPTLGSGMAMAYDSERGKTVLFGGYSSTTNRYAASTWEWDGSAWTQAAATGPTPRFEASMAFDSTRGKTILFGGYGGALSNDTWEWDGSTWTQAAPSGPSPRTEAAIAYDSARGKVMLYGGYTSAPMIVFGDTWACDGAGWSPVAATGPGGRRAAAMAYDSARERLVLFGGTGYVSGALTYFGDTWEYDGAGWTKVATTGPGARRWAAMSYDPVRRKVVLFGGDYESSLRADTWEWDGSRWTQVAVTGPSARSGAAMTYDIARGKMLLYGSGARRDVWEYDGTAWTQLSTMGPDVRYWSTMTYDSARNRPIIFGGDGNIPFPGSTWQRDGSDWLRVASTGPSARSWASMAYDAARKKVVLFGGSDDTGMQGDTWEYTPHTYTVPDVTNALRQAAGFAPAQARSFPELDVTPSGPSAGRVDVEDAVRIVRKAAGLEPNP